jgi:four helix bundle protein
MTDDKQFRFQDLTIWQRGALLSDPLFQLADQLERKRLYRFAEQLRGATLSVTNNIAEGAGSVSRADFAHFLNMSRRSVFEVANILLLLVRQNHCASEEADRILQQLEEESRMILAFWRRLKS